jgi:1-acyl-sn-glycerol-3-phosphate acyltransferase
VRLLVVPLLRLWFRVRISDAENIPPEGAAIIAPNHKSFLDAFFLAIATRRHVRYMAKTELFCGPPGWLFPRLGAFPVRRGEAEAEAIETAGLILEQGGLLVMFPEGTRVEESDALGSPHRSAGRLALETGRRAHKVRTSGCALVLVQQPADAVCSVHPHGTVLAERGWFAQRIRCREGERSVRALAVVVVDVGVERSLESPFAKDEQPVQALLTDRAHPALGMGR